MLSQHMRHLEARRRAGNQDPTQDQRHESESDRRP